MIIYGHENICILSFSLFHNSVLSNGGEVLEYVAQRGSAYPILKDIQGQSRWGSKKPHIAAGVPVHSRQLDQMTF